MSTRKDACRELKRLLWTFRDDTQPSSSQDGINEYRRMERRVEKILVDTSALNRWQKIRMNIILNLASFDDELDRDISDYCGFQREKKGRR